MTSLISGSSAPGHLSDLDGFSFNTHNDHSNHADSDDFGFDPPVKHMHNKHLEQMYSPPEQTDSPLCAWSIFDQPKEEAMHMSPTSTMHSTELDRMIAQTLPNATTAIARYGQVTPPRSNSETSITKSQDEMSKSSERRSKRATKASAKEMDKASNQSSGTKKKRNTRKSSVAATGNPEEDEKRRQSLEKNRLAAAKCRINKKEKTEQLQRDSHDKAVHNAFLKEQLMHMKEEVQQMNALLLGHASCDGCKSPEDIQKHLSNLGNEFFANHMPSMVNSDFGGFPPMSMDMSHLDDDQSMQDNYFSPDQQSMMNPSLPDFDGASDFDVQTPMHTD